MTGERLPLGPLRSVLRLVEGPAGLEAAAFGPLLAVYTAVLLADTSTPTWNDARDELPFVFVSSASLASAGLAMVTTPVAETAPARKLAVLGVIGELVTSQVMLRRMDPVANEPLNEGRAGTMLRLSEALASRGRARDPARRPPPRCRGRLRAGAAGRVGAHPVRDIRRRHPFRQGSALHDRTAETAARRPPRGRPHRRFDHHGRLNGTGGTTGWPRGGLRGDRRAGAAQLTWRG